MIAKTDVNIHEGDANGRLPIHVAAVFGQPTVLSYLIRVFSMNLRQKHVPENLISLLDDDEVCDPESTEHDLMDTAVSYEDGDLSNSTRHQPVIKLSRRPNNSYIIVAANYHDSQQWTPLHHASSEEAINDYPACLRILIDSGANPMLHTPQGKTALDLAYGAGRTQVLVDVLPKQQLIELLMRIDDIVPLKARKMHDMKKKNEKMKVARESALLFDSQHKHHLRVSPVESVRKNSEDLDFRSKKGYSFIRQIADTMDNAPSGRRRHSKDYLTGQKSDMANVMSVWRKILLNDNVELLGTLRDSMVWREKKIEQLREKLDFSMLSPNVQMSPGVVTSIEFEGAQSISQKQMTELFFDCYENGTGVFSHVQSNYHDLLKINDFRTILRAMTGLLKFRTLSTDHVVIIKPMHKSLLFLSVVCGRFRVAEMLLRMRQFDILPVAVLIILILQRLKGEPSFPQQVSLALKNRLCAFVYSCIR